MAKVNIENVELALSENQVDPAKIKQILADLQKAIEDEKALRKQTQTSKEVKIKYVVANSDIPEDTPITETPVFVVEALDSVPHHSVVDAMIAGAKEANVKCRKLKKNPIKTVFEIAESCPPKFLKEKGIRVITKEMPQVLLTDNKIT